MPKKSLLSLEGEDIVIHGLDTIVNFTRFHPVNVDLFLDGLELADDLKADTGTILYTKNTEISHERIAKLLKLRESNSNLDFNFQIKRNEKLLNKFREELKERMLTMLKRRQATKVFKDLMVGVANSIESFYDLIFEDEEILLALYRIRFICVSAESQRSIFYADHAINMSLFALAVAESRKMEEAVGKNKEKLIEIVKASLFHNFGALLEIDEILQLPANERPQKYWEANLKGLDKITSLRFSYELMMGIRGLCDYHAGRRDFIPKLEGSELLANILVVADVFLQSESGLFGEPVEARTVVDKMNVKAMGKELNDVVIQALTLGLNLTDIFDFYSEMERLKSKCPYEAAVPYPLTGFNSPTIFVCKKRVTKCQYLEVSVKAVNLITNLGELKSGEYNRCKLLTPSLMSFYEEHYEEIKESTTEKPKGQAAAKPGAAPKTDSASKPPAAAKPAQAEKQEKS